MENIPPGFLMIVIIIFTLTAVFVGIYLVMLLREATETTKELKASLRKTNSALDDVQEVVSAVKVTSLELNDTVLKPVRQINSFANSIQSFVEGFAASAGDRKE